MAEEDFKVSILASSSTGNSTYIEAGGHKILVDAGLSGKKIAELMQSINRDLNDVDALFVTHEHSDHIQSVGVLARKYHIPIYANHTTWEEISGKIGKIPLELKNDFETDQIIHLDNLDVESFPVSHDAVKPQFYRFMANNKSFVCLTDTGYVSEKLVDRLKGAQGYLLETNHDVQMLQMGSYPWSLKQRILGKTGHLSNLEAAQTLNQLVNENTKNVYMGHRSQQNNQLELAQITVQQFLDARDVLDRYELQLHNTAPLKATHLNDI